ncbi:MAG: hypothetical protein ACYCU7_07520 [Acidimicrobiales bacterium]
MAAVAVLDDRLLIEELLVGLPRRREELYTTTSWYYRACRAAVLGAGGHLSGPFALVDPDRQEAAILSLLELREDISLPEPRETVPEMARLAGRHPRLNLMNLEAAAFGRLVGATVWLSHESARGMLPTVLDHEHVRWRTVTIE